MPLPGRLLSTIAPVLAIMRHLNTQLAYSDQATEHLVAHDARVQRLMPMAQRAANPRRSLGVSLTLWKSYCLDRSGQI